MPDYPNHEKWYAMRDGLQVEAHKLVWTTRVVEVGEVDLPSGKLVIYDPSSLEDRYSYKFYPNGSRDESYYFLPIGKLPIFVTTVTADNGNIRNAYTSVTINPEENEVRRSAAIPVGNVSSG
jgi:hypothetical protein